MPGSQEQHFRVAVGLMLFFFVMAFVSESLVAFHLVAIDIMGESSKQAYLLFSGIALGMMRGMPADNPPGTIETKQSETITPPAPPDRQPPPPLGSATRT